MDEYLECDAGGECRFKVKDKNLGEISQIFVVQTVFSLHYNENYKQFK